MILKELGQSEYNTYSLTKMMDNLKLEIEPSYVPVSIGPYNSMYQHTKVHH